MSCAAASASGSNHASWLLGLPALQPAGLSEKQQDQNVVSIVNFRVLFQQEKQCLSAQPSKSQTSYTSATGYALQCQQTGHIQMQLPPDET